MKMTVLLFGPYARMARNSSVDVERPDGVALTAGQVKASLVEQCPELGGILSPAIIAVNHQAVRPNHAVRETDELAVVGLVGGG